MINLNAFLEQIENQITVHQNVNQILIKDNIFISNLYRELLFSKISNRLSLSLVKKTEAFFIDVLYLYIRKLVLIYFRKNI